MVQNRQTKSRRGPGKRHGAAGIRDALRREIIDGALAPNTKLPTHLVLSQRFGVSNVTIQNALNQLAADGFIEIRPRVGSFVVEEPPHIHNVGLVFAFDPEAPAAQWQWSRYYQTLAFAATRVQEETGRHFLSFYGIDSRNASGDHERLVQDIARQRLAGLIFANPTHGLHDTPVVDAPGLPRVEIHSGGGRRWPALRLDPKRWLAGALDRLAERGCRRVAILFHRLRGSELAAPRRLDPLLAERGMVCPPYWRQAVEWRDATATNHCTQLLMRGPSADRPEGLVITDDNLIDGAVAGLVAAGVRVPEDLAVGAGGSLPLLAGPAVPLELLAYDLGAVLRDAVALLDRQRREGPFQETITQAPAWHSVDPLPAEEAEA